MMKRSKLLLVLTTTLGGTGLHAYYMARDLDKAKFEVYVAFGPGQRLDQQFESLDVHVHHISMKRTLSPLTHLAGLLQLYRLMRREQFDVLCAYCSMAGFLSRIAAKLAGVPVSIFCVHLFASHDYLSPVRRWLYLWIERGLDRLTHHYIAVSHAMQEEGIRKRIFTAEKVSVLYNGLDLRPFDRTDRQDGKQRLGIASQSPVVGTIGRLEQQKGMSYFLQAMALVHSAMPEVQFLIVGDGPLRPQLEHLAQQLGLAQSLIFTGWRDDTADLLACMDVFCLASLWESFGFVLLEAMAMQKPIVATRVGGVPEVVEDGYHGLLVPPEDSVTLAQGVLTLLRDPALAQRFGEAGRKRVETRFVVEHMIAQYEQLLQALLDRTRTGN